MTPLPDLLADDLRLVVCGSAAGARSAAVGHYYAGPGNAFWRMLAETGLTPRQLAPAEYRTLLDHGIGLTDVVKNQSGPDAAIDFARADRAGLRAKIERHQPAVLCFNGKRAAEIFFARPVGYGPQEACVGATQLFVAPSTSGAARGHWDARVWHALAAVVRATSARSR